jgi:hypothetical protein
MAEQQALSLSAEAISDDVPSLPSGQVESHVAHEGPGSSTTTAYPPTPAAAAASDFHMNGANLANMDDFRSSLR